MADQGFAYRDYPHYLLLIVARAAFMWMRGFRSVPCLASRVVLMVIIIFVVVMMGLGQAGQVQVIAALVQLMRHSRYWSQQRA